MILSLLPPADRLELGSDGRRVAQPATQVQKLLTKKQGQLNI